VRQHGRLGTAKDLAMHDHACWIYDDDGERREAVVDFLRDGLELGQRLLYVGGDSVERLRDDLESLDGVEPLIEGGALQVLSLTGERSVDPVDAERRLEAYAAAADQAVADGYAGLRVAVAVTGSVAGRGTWDAHKRWESLVDRSIVSRPLTALCLYDRREVPDRVLADLASLHPVSHGPAGMVPFRVFFSSPDALVLEGEVDYFCAADLGRLLDVTRHDDGEVVLDLSGLGFVDHHGVMALVEHARRFRERNPLRFDGVPHPVTRLCDLMGVTL
jgi:ABC-type transporter Mla MlaB component